MISLFHAPSQMSSSLHSKPTHLEGWSHAKNTQIIFQQQQQQQRQPQPQPQPQQQQQQEEEEEEGEKEEEEEHQAEDQEPPSAFWTTPRCPKKHPVQRSLFN